MVAANTAYVGSPANGPTAVVVEQAYVRRCSPDRWEAFRGDRRMSGHWPPRRATLHDAATSVGTPAVSLGHDQIYQRNPCGGCLEGWSWPETRRWFVCFVVSVWVSALSCFVCCVSRHSLLLIFSVFFYLRWLSLCPVLFFFPFLFVHCPLAFFFGLPNAATCRPLFTLRLARSCVFRARTSAKTCMTVPQPQQSQHAGCVYIICLAPWRTTVHAVRPQGDRNSTTLA